MDSKIPASSNNGSRFFAVHHTLNPAFVTSQTDSRRAHTQILMVRYKKLVFVALQRANPQTNYTVPYFFML